MIIKNPTIIIKGKGGETLGGEYNIEQVVDGDNCELVITTAGQPENKLAQLVDGSITEITAEDFGDITRIRPYAFYSCGGLKSVEFPDTMYIGDYAFMKSGLTGTVVIPYRGMGTYDDSSLGRSAFEECTKITKVIINTKGISGNINAKRYFYGCTNLKEVEFGETCETPNIGSYAFAGCSALQSITLPSTVKYLTERCFSGCTSLETISLPDGLIDIYERVFDGCKKLNNVVLPNGFETIGTYAFNGCTGLTNISIPDSIISVKADSFNGCSNLIYNISDNVKYLGNSNNSYTLLCGVVDKTLTEYSIEDGCKFISGKAFQSCSSWAGDITIPDSVVDLGSYAFAGCSSLTKLTIGNNVKTQSYSEGGLHYAFQNCTSLKEAVIGDGVNYLNYTFYGCKSLSDVTIGSGIKSIANYTFYNCSALKTITIKATTPPTLSGMSGMSTLTTIYIPAGTLNAYQTATNWSSFASKFVEMEA